MAYGRQKDDNENKGRKGKGPKKMKVKKQNLSTRIRFLIFVERNLYQNRKENLAFATRASEHFKKYFEN